MAVDGQPRVRLLQGVLGHISKNLESMITVIDQNDPKSRMQAPGISGFIRGRGVSVILPMPPKEIVNGHKKGGAAFQPHRLWIDSYNGD